MGIEINAVADLAAALADEGQFHAIQESQTAADIGGGFTAGEIARRATASGSSRTALEDLGRDNGDFGAGIEKSSGNCPEGAEESCRDCEMFVRTGMTFGSFKANRDVWFRAISSALFHDRL
jgi:hypothetical protein